jgi:N4-gp56 family major capsid protein
MPQTAYGDISPRTAAWASVQLLTRGEPFLVLEKFGQAKPMPKKRSDSVTFRRYNSLPATPNELTEGVTPAAKQLTKTDVPATVKQYGDLVQITDVVMDLHEDPVLKEATDILGEQAAEMIETVRFNKLKAGTAVEYSGTATQRSEVVDPVSIGLQRRITKLMKRQNARPITSVMNTTPDFNSEPIAPAYIAVCHTDLETDISNMEGFVPVERYSGITPYPSEIGKVGNVRYIGSQVLVPWEGAGAANTAVENDGSNVNVYPILYFARDAYGIVSIKGKSGLKPIVVNPKPSDSDPLAQRGYVGWKAYHTAVILNDAWMYRAEVACTL